MYNTFHMHWCWNRYIEFFTFLNKKSEGNASTYPGKVASVSSQSPAFCTKCRCNHHIAFHLNVTDAKLTLTELKTSMLASGNTTPLSGYKICTGQFC